MNDSSPRRTAVIARPVRSDRRRTVLMLGTDGEAAGTPGPACINGCGSTLELGHCKNVCPTCGIWQTCTDTI